MATAYLRRLRRHWHWNLQDIYYKALAIVGITFTGTIIAFVVNINDFARLPLSLLDGHPWMFFLFSWTLIRGIQLGWSELFGTNPRGGRAMQYIWNATSDAFILMIGSFLGVVLALIVRGLPQSRGNLMALIVVMIIAVSFPFGLAMGVVDMQRQGFTRRVKRWSGFAAGAIMLIWLGVSAEMHGRNDVEMPKNCPSNASFVRP